MDNIQEIWRDVVGYEGIYKVSNYGRVFSAYFMQLLRPKLDRYNYIIYCLSKDNAKRFLKSHRIVAAAFIPNTDDKQFINHKNGIRWDNRVSNLEWCTHQENMNHMCNLGRTNGIKRTRKISLHKRKLSPETATIIKCMVHSKERVWEDYRQIADRFGVTQTFIGEIARGEKWASVHVIK